MPILQTTSYKQPIIILMDMFHLQPAYYVISSSSIIQMFQFMEIWWASPKPNPYAAGGLYLVLNFNLACVMRFFSRFLLDLIMF